MNWSDIIGDSDDGHKRRQRLLRHQHKYSGFCDTIDKQHVVALYECYQEAESIVVQMLVAGIPVFKSLQVELAKKKARMKLGDSYDKKSWMRALNYLKAYHESADNDIYFKHKHLYLDDKEYEEKYDE